MEDKLVDVDVSFEHPPFKEDWFHLDRSGAPFFMDAYLKTWGLPKPEKFKNDFYPYGELEDAFLLFKGDRFYGRWWSMKKFALTITDYLSKENHLEVYLQNKDAFIAHMNTVWEKYPQKEVLSMSAQDTISFAKVRQEDMIESWIKDAIAPFIGEIASGYTNWLLENKGVSESDRPRIFNLVFAYPKISATIERQLTIKNELDGLSDEKRDAKAEELATKYAYAKSDFIGYVTYTKEDVLKEYDQAQLVKTNVEGEYQEREKALSTLNLTPTERKIFDIFAYSAFSRDERRAYQQRLFALLDWSLENLATHYEIPHTTLKFITTDELTHENLNDEAFKKKLQDRYDQGFMLYWRTRGTGQYLFGKEAQTLFDALDTIVVDKGTAALHGQPTYKGKVTGKVKIIMDLKVEIPDEPFVLVTGMTSPDYIHYMQKCVAIITNEGGITCHASILSRELKKPCIIGTKIATKVLKDGDMVEVDAERGIITLIK